MIADAPASRWSRGGDRGAPAPDLFARADAREQAAVHLQHLAEALRLGEHQRFDDHVLMPLASPSPMAAVVASCRTGWVSSST